MAVKVCFTAWLPHYPRFPCGFRLTHLHGFPEPKIERYKGDSNASSFQILSMPVRFLLYSSFSCTRGFLRPHVHPRTMFLFKEGKAHCPHRCAHSVVLSGNSSRPRTLLHGSPLFLSGEQTKNPLIQLKTNNKKSWSKKKCSGLLLMSLGSANPKCSIIII